VVGLLAGTLNGAAMGKDVIDFNQDVHSVTDTGQAIAIIDPAAFGEVSHFKQQVDVLIRDIRNSERIPGVDRIWLPGEQSHTRRATYLREGIPLPGALMQSPGPFVRTTEGSHLVGNGPLTAMFEGATP